MINGGYWAQGGGERELSTCFAETQYGSPSLWVVCVVGGNVGWVQPGGQVYWGVGKGVFIELLRLAMGVYVRQFNFEFTY